MDTLLQAKSLNFNIIYWPMLHINHTSHISFFTQFNEAMFLYDMIQYNSHVMTDSLLIKQLQCHSAKECWDGVTFRDVCFYVIL